MPKSIQYRLFVNYTIVVTITIVVFIMLFYFYTSDMIEKKASESLYQLANTVARQIDNELDKMDTIQKKVLFSETGRGLIFDNPKSFESNNVVLQRKFNELINLASGPDDFRNYQTNIYNLNGNFAGIGQNCFIKRIPPEELDQMKWIGTALSMDGKKVITQPHTTKWWKYDTTVVSMFRAFTQDDASMSAAVIEVQMDYTVIKDIIGNALHLPESNGESGQNIIILGSNHELIYPLEEKGKPALPVYFYVSELNSKDSQDPAVKIKNPYSGRNEILSSNYSDFSGWTVITTESESVLLQPIVKLRNSLIFLGIVAILLTMLITYFIARKISNPIKGIHKSLKSLRLDALPEDLPHDLNSGIVEIEGLNRVFNEMCKKLKISLDELVSARSHEIQARFLAVQSQINPHFLYNTLATLKIMGKEGENEGIVKICSDLSKMLRYISDSGNSPVRLADEIEHTRSYLSLMKVRYQDKLLYELDIPGNMYDIRLPKLIVQPLAENCIKYGTDIYPPWIIRITGEIRDGIWRISVSDNGKGFEEDKIVEVKDKFARFDPKYDFPAAKINGMGLVNIFVRLKLLYKDQAVFDIGSSPSGGAVVTIGGPVPGICDEEG